MENKFKVCDNSDIRNELLSLIFSDSGDNDIKDMVLGYVLGSIEDYIKEKGIEDVIGDYIKRKFDPIITRLQIEVGNIKADTDYLMSALSSNNIDHGTSIGERLNRLEELIMELKYETSRGT